MYLDYYVSQNRITSNTDDYMAVSVDRQRYTIEQVYEYMTREGSTLTKAEALAAFEEVTQGIINIVREGNTVVTPLVNIMPSISGVFDSDEDSFDPERHQVNLRMTPGVRLRKVPPSISTNKVRPRMPQPELIHYFDKATDTEDDEVSPDEGGRISGELLKFDMADPDQGIFFVNTADNSETRIDPDRMLRNMPSELLFINPQLPAGDYWLEVRSIINGNSHTRTGRLLDELTVA